MMQPPFVYLALVYAFARSVEAAPPVNGPISIAVSAVEQSALLTQRDDSQQNCGPEHDNMKCPDGQCCSHDGNCGSGPDFCSVPLNCQRNFGWCDSDYTPAGYNMSTDSRQQKGDVPYGTVITSCNVPSTIALVFNDGPSENSEELLSILQQANATATFFVAGNTGGRGSIDGTEERTDLIRRMVEEGHQVGSHTWSHPDLDEMDSDARKQDMLKNERALANVLGKYPTYMRPPYMNCTGGCLDDMKILGYHVISHSHDSGDWRNEDDLDMMKENVDQAFNETAQDGNLLLIQHDTIRKSAVNLTEYVLQKVQERSWRAITVGECLGDEPSDWYREPLWATPAARAENGCVVSGTRFCGKINDFKNRRECFESNQQCHKDADTCNNDTGTDKEACQTMERLCNMQFLYCAECGHSQNEESNDTNECEMEHFVVNKQD